MINSVKARTPILALILFLFGIGNAFAETKVVVIPMAGDAAPKSSAFQRGGGQFVTLRTTPRILRNIIISQPVDGMAIVNSTVAIRENAPGDGVNCSITTLSEIDVNYRQDWESAGTVGAEGQLAGTRGFPMLAEEVYDIKLVCVHTGTGSSTSTAYDSSLTVIFIPN